MHGVVHKMMQLYTMEDNTTRSPYSSIQHNIRCRDQDTEIMRSWDPEIYRIQHTMKYTSNLEHHGELQDNGELQYTA